MSTKTPTTNHDDARNWRVDGLSERTSNGAMAVSWIAKHPRMSRLLLLSILVTVVMVVSNGINHPVKPAQAMSKADPPQPTMSEAEFQQLQKDVYYQQIEGKLYKQLLLVHDNGGSSAEQCALIGALRLNAQQWGNEQEYRAWQAVNAEEMLYERDMTARGFDVHQVSKRDEKLAYNVSLREPRCY